MARRHNARTTDQKMKLNPLAALILLLGIVTTFAQDDTRPSATWQVVKYDINATLPQSETDRNLTSKVKIDLRNASGRAASTLTLRISPAAVVSAVMINGAPVEFTKGEEKVGTG